MVGARLSISEGEKGLNQVLSEDCIYRAMYWSSVMMMVISLLLKFQISFFII